MPIYVDESGRSASSRALMLRGVIVATVLALLGVALYQGGTGEFNKTFHLTVLTNVVGEGLAPGGEVKFHGLTIGSVKTLEPAGYGKQRMIIALDPAQARALSADTKAKFTSSNIFGTAAVELVSSGTGSRLKSNGILEMTGDTAAPSVTGVMRQAQKITSVLDTREFTALFTLLQKNMNLTAPTIKTMVDGSKMVSDSLTVPFSQSLSVIASFVGGVDESIPLISQVNQLLDKLDFVVVPGGEERAIRATSGFTLLLKKATEGFAKHMNWVVPLVSTVFDIIIPSFYFLGSLLPAFDRVSGLADRTGGAFRIEDNKVRMQVQLIMDTAPGMVAAAPPADQLPVGPSPAPGLAAATQGAPR